MNETFATERSKYLSLILRHEPARAGLTLDKGGWVAVSDLLAGLKARGRGLSRQELEYVVKNNDKKRFTLSEDGLRIRAAQGHSVDIESDLVASTPPPKLFHGTASRFVDTIMTEGLKPMGRTHVHLSLDVETATKVGSRHGKPCVLVVDTARMAAHDDVFYVADNGVWLSKYVPFDFLTIQT